MVQAEWHRWRKMTGIQCYRRASDVKPAMMCGLETVDMAKKHDKQHVGGSQFCMQTAKSC